MPSPNSTSGTTQHVDAASAPRMAPKVRRRWLRSSPTRLASAWARVMRFSAWSVMAFVLHPVAATGSRGISMRSIEPQATFSIGELSRRTGVNIGTIRYYERIQILPAPPRTTSGRRVYGPAESRILTFVRRARELGFTLDEIRILLALSAENGRSTCGEVREAAAPHLADIRTKIADLRA